MVWAFEHLEALQDQSMRLEAVHQLVFRAVDVVRKGQNSTERRLSTIMDYYKNNHIT